MSTNSTDLAPDDSDRHILQASECDLESRQALEQALQDPAARIPPQFEDYFYKFQTIHQKLYLQQVNHIGQLAFLLYFFADYFVLPDVSLLSGIARVIVIVLAISINYFLFKYVKDIRIHDQILPVGALVCAGLWFYLMSLSNSPYIDIYIYASVIFVVLANLCIQVRFKPALYTSFLISTVVFLGVSNLTSAIETIIFALVYLPIWLFSLYISWTNTLNARRNFLRTMLNDWNFHILQELAHTDELTQLSNRRQFVHIAEHKVHEWPQHASTCLLMFDVDYFKQINDTHGHDVGDQVLQTIADIARKEMRRKDILARFGGEEFTALLTETSLQDALLIAERLRTKIAQHRIYIGQNISLNFTVSIGVSELKAEQPDLTTLIKEADIALYAAKQHGRNCVLHYDIGMSEPKKPACPSNISWVV
ncbi:GGDEF domain-containing protein [Acinetobacter indicus]|uniref:GGDEF domain-containing protein n=1 Tax=Acinetobacter indicus TaxID=756892 RepID=UPI001362E3A0|nr:GGDEF domain-containing protein [Acinetobacter indicus]